MSSLNVDYVDDIEKMLANFLMGKSLNIWCKEISDSFIDSTQQSFPPFSITKILPTRRIRAEHDNNISVPGKIESTKKGFLLKLNPSKLKSKSYYNYVLAHEVAHTFFYDISEPEPVDISGLPISSKYLEYLCNRLARYLIIPSKSICKELSALPSIESSEFNLGCINSLLNKYEISLVTLLNRIIIDEPLWNAVFLRFKFFSETNSWKLIESYKPRGFNTQLFFIPQPDKFKNNTDPEKYPTVKNNLNLLLRSLHLELSTKKRISKKIEITSLKGEPLNTYFNNYNDKAQIIIHSSYDRINQIINIAFPITEHELLVKPSGVRKHYESSRQMLE